MATNKNAQLRYRTIDKALRNQSKRLNMEGLMAEIDEALSQYGSSGKPISRRQVHDDIEFMKSEAGFKAPIETHLAGKYSYYYYTDKDYSIDSRPISESERKEIEKFIVLLGRFGKLDDFKGGENILAKLKSTLDIDNHKTQVISFEENKYLVGIEHLNPLYQAIINKQTLKIKYKNFNVETADNFIISPYYLKQYNNRWFLYCKRHNSEQFSSQSLTNLALDRIQNIDSGFAEYIDFDEDFEIEEIFEDIVGVSFDEREEVKTVRIKLDEKLVPYIQSKPFHGSQILNGNILKIKVKLNYELESEILAHGEKMEVLEPKELKDKIIKRAELLLNQYKMTSNLERIENK